ncbi:MAG: hypothetical protein ABIA21_01935 [Candidatus Aenigmatarchaeota archaeon]
MTLESIAKEASDIIRPFGETDVLLYYGIVARKLKRYLKGKEIASRNCMPPGGFPHILRRGSNNPVIWIDDFVKETNPSLIEARKINRYNNLTPIQQTIWRYFLPHKLSDFFYATNGEKPGKSIERIFIDLDIGTGITPKKCQIVARALVEEIRKEKIIRSYCKPKPFVLWTGRSFHVYIFLKKPQPNSFYIKYIQYSKNKSDHGLIGKWAKAVENKTGIQTCGGHQKVPQTITLDPSQTPSGKLCRAPFSLHMSDWKTVDGIAIPLRLSQLRDPQLIRKLQEYTPEKVVKDLNKLAKNLP